MAPRTIFLSRLIGLYCILVAPVFFLQRDALTGVVSNSPMMLMFCLTWLVAGLSMVLAHNIWSGGAAVVVTLVGWLTLIKTLVFLILPYQTGLAFSLKVLHNQQLFAACLAPTFLIGVYLTYAGFSSKSRS